MKKIIYICGSIIGLILFGVTCINSYAALSTVTYPISELGNCANQHACKIYCDDTSHTDACLSYAQQHQLLSEQEIQSAREYQDVLKGKGPGACTDQASCRTYCDDITHIQECVAFAGEHNLLSSEELTKAQQVAKALAHGAQLPGGCTNAQSCETFCADTKNTSSCLTFAETAGIMNKEEITEAKKMIPLVEQGKTPGKCTDKKSCETYCADNAHIEECATFAESAGILTKEEAEMVRKTGGKGPGGCTSQQTCDAYCNNDTHQEECLTFAEKYNLIPEQDLKDMKEGMAQLRANADQLPEAALTCLQEKLGADTVAKMKAGTLTPGKQMGQQIKSCIENSLGDIKEKTKKALEQATPEVISCLKEKLSADDFAKVQQGELTSPKAGTVMKTCFAKLQEEGAKKMKEGLTSLTPEMKTCVKQKVGDAKFQKLEQGELSQEDSNLKEVFEGCVEEGMKAIEQQMEAKLQEAPESIRACIKEKIAQIKERAKTDSSMRSEAAVQPYIQECIKEMPIPAGEGKLPPGTKPQGMTGDEYLETHGKPRLNESTPPPGAPAGMDEKSACANFASAPSCSYVPPQFQDLCKKCKGE